MVERIIYAAAETEKTKIIARLMDAGKLIYGKVRLKEIIDGSFYKILIRIIMRD